MFYVFIHWNHKKTGLKMGEHLAFATAFFCHKIYCTYYFISLEPQARL
jgi:hypothetical protein